MFSVYVRFIIEALTSSLGIMNTCMYKSELLRKAIWSMFQIRICLILQVSFTYFKVTEFTQEFNETILLC